MPDDSGEVVRKAPNRRRGEELALVLEALGIPHGLEPGDGAWVLRVPWAERDRAVAALDAYEREPPRRRWRPRSAPITLLGVHVGVILAAFAMASGPRAARSTWFEVGSARASALLAGEPWRAVTALTLHADAGHLLSNAALGVLILGALGGVWGAGMATLLTVASGALGNFVNAWVRSGPHDAVGASTALFGAIGVLAGTGFVARRRAVFGKPWVTIAAALGLLAMLGAGEETDVLAHLFGLAAGVVLGVAAARVTPCAPGAPAQVGAGLLALVVVTGAWVTAFAP